MVPKEMTSWDAGPEALHSPSTTFQMPGFRRKPPSSDPSNAWGSTACLFFPPSGH